MGPLAPSIALKRKKRWRRSPFNLSYSSLARPYLAYRIQMSIKRTYVSQMSRVRLAPLKIHSIHILIVVGIR